MARGMNWGIFSLLGVIVLVLGGVAAFFVYLARRAASLAAEPVRLDPGEPSDAGNTDAFGFPELESTEPLL
jgi:hypothetical protein